MTMTVNVGKEHETLMANYSIEEAIKESASSLIAAQAMAPRAIEDLNPQVPQSMQVPVAHSEEVAKVDSAVLVSSEVKEIIEEAPGAAPLAAEEPDVHIRGEVLAEMMALADELAAKATPEPSELSIDDISHDVEITPLAQAPGSEASPKTEDLVAYLNASTKETDPMTDVIPSEPALQDFDPVRYLAGGGGNTGTSAQQTNTPSVPQNTPMPDIAVDDFSEVSSGPRDQRQILQMLGELRSLRD